MKKTLLIIAVMAALASCTKNRQAKQFGGEMTIDVTPNHRVVSADWKGDELWYFTEPMDSSYKPKPKQFQEYSSYGIWQGKVIFIESKVVEYHTELPWYLNK